MNWLAVLSASALAGVLSLLTSLAGLPEVEWVGRPGAGDVVIITGFIPTVEPRFETEYMMRAGGYRGFFTPNQTKAANGWHFLESDTGITYWYGGASSASGASGSVNVWHSLSLDRKLVRDGVVVADYSNKTIDFSTNTKQVIIGASPNRKAFRVKRSKLFDNNVLCCDLVPCYVKATGKIGMYDLIAQTFIPFTTSTGEDVAISSTEKGADVT